MKVEFTTNDERHIFSGVHTISESQTGAFELYISAGGTHSITTKRKTKRETYQRITSLELPLRAQEVRVVVEGE